MNILGIIAEFNPLHTGHEYLLKTLRRETGADFCVVVMSGDYVQRGEPAFFTKELRTEAALLAGADLVLELPLAVSTGSAEYFAEGAVSLLENLGCITHLGFGSENGDINAFRLAGELLCQESGPYRLILQELLQTGMSFPKARYEALSAVSAEKYPPETLSLLQSPNNILGTEYLKALKKLRSSITPVTVKRAGAAYHEILPSEENISSLPAYASASGLRNRLEAFPASPETDSLLEKYVPLPCRALCKNALQNRQYLTSEDFFLPLFSLLEYSSKEELTAYQDITPDLAGRILRCYSHAASYQELCGGIKSKNLTSVRINRSLLHILLRLTKENVSLEKENGFCLYARMLGFRREAAPLLTEIKKHASVPLVSKTADAHRYLSPLAFSQLRHTLSGSKLYRAAMASVSAEESKNTGRENLVIL